MKKSLSPTPGNQSFFIQFFATFFSYVFHPVFIASYVMALLVFVHPDLYSQADNKIKLFRFISVFFTTTFLPIFSVFLLWRLKLFTESMQLRTSKERIIPYLLVMIFYFWVWHVFNNIPTPPEVVHFFLGSFLAICGAWFCNIYFKISMHTVAVGGLLMFAVLFSMHDSYSSGLNVGIAVLVTGIVCTSRFIISDHTSFEIYSGLFVGILAQLIAWQF